MKKITIEDPIITGTVLYQKPEYHEIHLSEPVSRVMGSILGLIDEDKCQDITLLPDKVLERIKGSMEPYRHRMVNAGLTWQDFCDLIMTLETMAKYARLIRGKLRYRPIPEEKTDDYSEDDHNPYG